MTAVYRAYSPSRDRVCTPHLHPDRAAADTAIRNQRTSIDGGPADWVVQTGHVEWETP